MTNSERNHPFVECGRFADEIRVDPAKDGIWQYFWHFVDTGYFNEGGSYTDFPDFKIEKDSINLAIPYIMNWLTRKGDYQSTFVYKEMIKRYPTEDQALSVALRLLIHYLGDVHQPLHTVARVNSHYPEGDHGGNGVKLPELNGTDNLHSVWDSMVMLETSRLSLPFNEQTWNEIGIKC